MLAAQDETETDTGPRDKAARVERLCLATRTVKPTAEMIRFVVGPDGAVVPDLKRNLPGRGVWVTATREAVAEAVKRGGFARGFKRQVQVAKELVELTEWLCEMATLDALSMAYKGRHVLMGFTRVEAALARDDMTALIHAADAAPDGVRKLDASLRRRPQGDVMPVITAFTSAQLDLALGRSNVIHAALLAGPASEGFLARHRNLRVFRGATAETGPDERYGP